MNPMRIRFTARPVEALVLDVLHPAARLDPRDEASAGASADTGFVTHIDTKACSYTFLYLRAFFGVYTREITLSNIWALDLTSDYSDIYNPLL